LKIGFNRFSPKNYLKKIFASKGRHTAPRGKYKAVLDRTKESPVEKTGGFSFTPKVKGLKALSSMKGGKHSAGAVFGGIKQAISSIKGYFVHLNWPLILTGVLASVYGVFMIKSAGVTSTTVQIAAIILGVIAYFFIAMFDISHLAVFWKFVLAAGVALLLSVLVLGRSAGGNSGWIVIKLGSLDLSFQPGEAVKIFMIITISKHLDILGENIRTFKGVLAIGIHFALYAGALIFSKDDGMLLNYCILFIVLVFASGIQLRYLAIGGSLLLASTPLLWNYLLDDYQKMRILVVLDPTLDLDGKGYHAYISKIAIRNGGLTGMGYGKGRVTQLSKPGNLPAKHTDFIYSVICEEMGTIGALVALGLLLTIIILCFLVAAKVRHDRFSYLLSIGVASMLLFQTCLNVGMCLGVIPVIGLTLPFFSSGGSSVLTMFISIGMVASVGAHIRPRTLSDSL